MVEADGKTPARTANGKPLSKEYRITARPGNPVKCVLEGDFTEVRKRCYVGVSIQWCERVHRHPSIFVWTVIILFLNLAVDRKKTLNVELVDA